MFREVRWYSRGHGLLECNGRRGSSEEQEVHGITLVYLKSSIVIVNIDGVLSRLRERRCLKDLSASLTSRMWRSANTTLTRWVRAACYLFLRSKV